MCLISTNGTRVTVAHIATLSQFPPSVCQWHTWAKTFIYTVHSDVLTKDTYVFSASHTHRDSYSTVLFNCEWFSFLTPDRPPTPTPFLSAQFKSKQKKHLVSLSVWTTTLHSEEPRSTKRSVMTDCCAKTQPLVRISTMIRRIASYPFHLFVCAGTANGWRQSEK